MAKTINLVTHNLNKVKEFRRILEPEIKVNHLDRSYPELREESTEEIARSSARRLSKEFNIPVVVEDSGFFIEAFSGFPGICTAFVHRHIGIKGILRLMEGVKERGCSYISVIAYCEPGGEPVSFRGVEKGEVAEEARGSGGWGQDPIFIPEGKDKTYGQLREKEELPNAFRYEAIKKLKRFLLE